MQDSGSNTGATGRNYNLLAVSQTADPRGAFTIFGYDVTDDGKNGTPNHAGCPCFGDQPLLGADHFGIYQSTNEFNESGTAFNGAQVYAFSKEGIVEAAESTTAPLPVLVRIDASQALVPYGGLSYSIQPATSPNGGNDEDGRGTEYFLSALQFGNPGYEVYDNRIAVWALKNTRSLSSDTPSVSLLFAVISSETYGQPDPATQKAGEIPLGTSLGEPEELLNTNDDRMNQVVYADGLLYSGVNTKLSVGGASQAGIAWFVVRPTNGMKLKGSVVQQGYVAVKGNNVLFPSIAVSASGQGVIALSLAGPDYFPSAAYVDVSDGFAWPFIHVAGAGQDPDDGFTGYPEYTGGNVGRWGDYSAAVADGDGRIWFASEYIPNACSTLTLPCRTSLANWGTFIASIEPF
jgi:hypothetical protein